MAHSDNPYTDCFKVLLNIKRICTELDRCSDCPFQQGNVCTIQAITNTFPISWHEKEILKEVNRYEK